MTVLELCDGIDLQPEIKHQVAAFAKTFDFSQVEILLSDLRDYKKMHDAQTGLQSILGADPDHIGILTCQLQASADAYAVYKEKGIDDSIYFDTMKCYTRFLAETKAMTGRLYFDRDFWTVRQAGCHLFRIGALEYEIKRLDKGAVIGLHIPSDAPFSPEDVDDSLAQAAAFFGKHYPELADCEYRCHSWLLEPALRGMLRADSNILHFQNRFEILDEGEASDEFLGWLFRTRSTDYAVLPEDTSLQRKVKQHVLSGGVMRESYGRLK